MIDQEKKQIVLKIEQTHMEKELKQDIETNYRQTDDFKRQISELNDNNSLLEQKLTDHEAELSLAKQSHYSYLKTLSIKKSVHWQGNVKINQKNWLKQKTL
ncbi:unnamed protein product (macronuclear) [Paramecium tetraurelia]|uniref:Uncharacterized protein n=1 Tax=Paramecium tetraurelia TaxID=5888 RepID=A0CKV4_PARTE|nr:uncharacterized protein GSPATT00007968001 [Paramecium tetraurelia]CAK71421.1 unnamed protein product [Paramecium tetraurelia]|eukprot:XP_001438818.1 hypothetical protein (macronuclear) [Paramecium tetraurelia strain d4-2]